MGGLTIDSVNFVTMPNTGKDGLQPFDRRNAFLRGAERAGAFESRSTTSSARLSRHSQCATLTSCPSTRMARVSSSTGQVEDSKAAKPQNHHSSSGSQTGTGDSARRPTRYGHRSPAIPATTAARRSTPAIPVTTAAVRPLIRATRAITAARPRQASPPRWSIP